MHIFFSMRREYRTQEFFFSYHNNENCKSYYEQTILLWLHLVLSVISHLQSYIISRILVNVKFIAVGVAVIFT